jgi:hypothetical protein
MPYRILCVAAAVFHLFGAVVLAGEPAAVPTFERDVRPILKAKCIRCHGEGDQLEGNLDLRLRRLIDHGGDSGPAIAPGNLDDSVLFQRIVTGEMPPAEVEVRLTTDEIETIRSWIAADAKMLREEPADADPNNYLTEEERNFWSFQPVVRPSLPAVGNVNEVRTAIDRFVLARLEQQQLSFSPPADKSTLIRRLYFDLLGLPPAPDEVQLFLEDKSPDGYERLVDRLLASPHYGERWGRHWLDAAGYADSEGYNDDDTVRPDAWKYRDYVVRALNSDKPYDRFVLEQLAGDELIGRELKNLSTDEAELLTATGYLRMAPDGTSSNADKNQSRNEVTAKTIEIVSTSLLGLTVGCAQCHNHRYDPIAQQDYYALRAVFEPALDWKNWRTPAQRRVSMYTDADRKRAAEIEEQAKQLDAERAKAQEKFIQQTFDKELAKLPSELHTALRELHATPNSKRTDEQKKLIQKYPSINVTAGSLYLYDGKAADELKRMSDEASQLRSRKPKEEFVRALWEPVEKTPPPTYLFARGQFDQPQQLVAPGPPRILAAAQPAEFPMDDPALPTTGRRLAMAKWLTSPGHPLTARVIVNRIWSHHFGRGLVESTGDFGSLGARPSHPELLDWLASEFVASGWSMKQLHRLLLRSTVYRQATLRRAECEQIDPENRLYWRANVRRLEAEVLRDNLLALGDQLKTKLSGPPVPVMADAVGQFIVGIENLNAGRPGDVIDLRGEQFRRSLYIQVRRSRPLSVMDPFDLPRMEPNCVKRAGSTVAPQSLLLMNNEFVTQSAVALAKRLQELAGHDVLGQVRWAWRLVYVDQPTESELSSAAQFILDQTTYFASHPVEQVAPPAAKSRRSNPVEVKAPADPQTEALASFCHAILSSNRFLYVD